MTPPGERGDLDEVIVADVGVDAVVREDPARGRVLFLRPGQSSGNAVEQVAAILPHWHPDEVRQLVREHLPEPAVDEQAAAAAALMARDLASGTSHRPTPRPRRRTYALRATAAALAAGALLGVGVAGGYSWGEADLVTDENAAMAAYLDEVSAVVGIECAEVYVGPGTCTDRQGLVMAVEALRANSSDASWVWYYDDDLIGVRRYADEQVAPLWATGQGVRRTLPHMTVSGRYAVWGTEPARVARWADALAEHEGVRPEAMPVYTPTTAT